MTAFKRDSLRTVSNDDLHVQIYSPSKTFPPSESPCRRPRRDSDLSEPESMMSEKMKGHQQLLTPTRVVQMTPPAKKRHSSSGGSGSETAKSGAETGESPLKMSNDNDRVVFALIMGSLFCFRLLTLTLWHC